MKPSRRQRPRQQSRHSHRPCRAATREVRRPQCSGYRPHSAHSPPTHTGNSALHDPGRSRKPALLWPRTSLCHSQLVRRCFHQLLWGCEHFMHLVTEVATVFSWAKLTPITQTHFARSECQCKLVKRNTHFYTRYEWSLLPNASHFSKYKWHPAHVF